MYFTIVSDTDQTVTCPPPLQLCPDIEYVEFLYISSHLHILQIRPTPSWERWSKFPNIVIQFWVSVLHTHHSYESMEYVITSSPTLFRLHTWYHPYSRHSETLEEKGLTMFLLTYKPLFKKNILKYFFTQRNNKYHFS